MVQHHVIYSPERKKQWSQSEHLQHKYKNIKRGCSLCSQPILLITSEWVLLLLLSPCCPCLHWASTGYLFPFQAGQAWPHPLPLNRSHFPLDPGNGPFPCRAQFPFLLYFSGFFPRSDILTWNRDLNNKSKDDFKTKIINATMFKSTLLA
jgi:hypothetical protein